MPTLSYIIPTRNRTTELTRTLDALGRLARHDAEVIVVDNASATRLHLPAILPNGLHVALIQREHNDGAAARNVGARMAAGEWLVMLDDDSHPTCEADTLVSILERQPENVAAVMADIRLPAQSRRESGGLPEVFIGCGVAIRRAIYLELGGYDAAFGFYAEEYDLAARMLLDGLRIAFEPRFTVDHHKAAAGRDMDVILHRLVRNNGWTMQRYAPEHARRAQLRETRARYRDIAAREHALAGFARGLVELRRTIHAQPRRAMPESAFSRFTGLAAARQALAIALDCSTARTVVLIDEGKNAGVIRHALRERGLSILENTASPAEADIAVIGTMSPGPMIDAAARHRAEIDSGRVIVPWRMAVATLNAATVPHRRIARFLPAA
jgi:GT2 family glycosyltransferase